MTSVSRGGCAQDAQGGAVICLLIRMKIIALVGTGPQRSGESRGRLFDKRGGILLIVYPWKSSAPNQGSSTD